MQLPDEINADLIEILGRPNFMCGGIAQAIRDGGVEIPRKAEAEQAHVLFKLVSLYARHGSGWRDAAADWIEGLSYAQQAKAARAKAEAAGAATAPRPHP